VSGRLFIAPGDVVTGRYNDNFLYGTSVSSEGWIEGPFVRTGSFAFVIAIYDCRPGPQHMHEFKFMQHEFLCMVLVDGSIRYGWSEHLSRFM
jgi:hypothetical protein